MKINAEKLNSVKIGGEKIKPSVKKRTEEINSMKKINGEKNKSSENIR